MVNTESKYSPGSLIKDIRVHGENLRLRGIPNDEISKEKNNRAALDAVKHRDLAYSIYEDQSVDINERRLQSGLCDFEATIIGRLANADYF